MKPVKFKLSNCILKGSRDVKDLPVYIGKDIIISKWKLTLIEKIKILFLGYIWFSIRAKKTHPAIKLSLDYPFWTQKELDRAKKESEKTN
jgi:hypothetical protein